MCKKYFFATFLFLLSSLSSAADPKEIIFGFIPSENRDLVEAKGKMFASWLTEQMGIPVKIFIANDYTSLIEAMRAHHVDLAWFPPFSFVQAEKVASAVPLVKSIVKGRAAFLGAIISRSDKGYKSIHDLKGKTIAWVDPTSTSGHIFPKANLIFREHINPDKFFSKQIFAGSHDAVVLSVLNKSVDAGATYTNDEKGLDSSWNLYLKSAEDRGKIKMLFLTDPIPTEAISTSKKFLRENPQLVKKLTACFVGMEKNESGKKILTEQYHIQQLVPAKSSDYDSVRAAARVLDIK